MKELEAEVILADEHAKPGERYSKGKMRVQEGLFQQYDPILRKEEASSGVSTLTTAHKDKEAHKKGKYKYEVSTLGLEVKQPS